MNEKDAARIALICATADGGCGPCVGSLYAQLVQNWPQNNWHDHFVKAGTEHRYERYWKNEIKNWDEEAREELEAMKRQEV